MYKATFVVPMRYYQTARSVIESFTEEVQTNIDEDGLILIQFVDDYDTIMMIQRNLDRIGLLYIGHECSKID